MSAVHSFPQCYECSVGTPAHRPLLLTTLVARSKFRTVFYRSNPCREFESHWSHQCILPLCPT